MDIHIFWDKRASAGLGLRVQRRMQQILDIPLHLDDNPVRMNGYSRTNHHYDAHAVLNALHIYKQRHAMTELILLVLGDELRTRTGAYLFGISRESVGVSVVSGARLANEFWGLPTDDNLLVERIAREGLHELGHLLGLAHCSDASCIMSNPLCFDDLDAKHSWFCHGCTQKHKRLHPHIYADKDHERSSTECTDFVFIGKRSDPIIS
jgi:archaemetzincin